ncbi:hypothetical protein [Streptomyces sp. NPDC087300]|uniref:hypothetical protein n=1 Tax=Streptomyces sp. NPDC087300 TaxID=3365780 RepID=UPI00382397ED
MPPQLRLTDQVRYVHVDHPGGLAAALDLLTHEEVPASQWELTALEGYRADEHTLALRTTPNVYADEGLLPLLVFA